MSGEHSRRGLDATRQAQMMQAFSLYRTATLLDVLDRPRTYAFVGGVVVPSEASVVSADPGGLVLRVNREQIAALERTGSVLVESPLHGATYRAEVEAVDRSRGFVSLRGLETFDAYHERRGLSRAAPGHPMLARISVGALTASGRVVDLSPRALAADFERERFGQMADLPLVRLEVVGQHDGKARLPDFVTTAHVCRCMDHDDAGASARRAVLEFEAYPALDRTLRQYVARRQREILLELRLSAPRSAPAQA